MEKVWWIAPLMEKNIMDIIGGIESFRAVAMYNVEDKFGISLLVNGDNFNRNDIMIGVLSLYYGKEYSFPRFKWICSK